MQMLGNSGAGRPPEVEADVKPVWLVGGLHRCHRSAQLCEVAGRFFVRKFLERRNVAHWQYQDMSTSVGVGIQNCERE